MTDTSFCQAIFSIPQDFMTKFWIITPSVTAFLILFCIVAGRVFERKRIGGPGCVV